MLNLVVQCWMKSAQGAGEVPPNEHIVSEFCGRRHAPELSELERQTIALQLSKQLKIKLILALEKGLRVF